MPEKSVQEARTKCRNCGYSAPVGSGAWDTATHPTLGELTQCPECGSTDTTGI
jgi:Zn finger protein HypA/HybF involved in hydrogenase expression